MDAVPETRPRFLPDEPLPPYTYVPGKTPHPVSDPAGHSFGVAPERPPTPDPERWWECRAYLRGIDLFNHGFYWEAHEAWEGLWHACGRKGTTADFLKGLIHLAAAGVKVRQGVPKGVVSHAARAEKLFHSIEQKVLFGFRIPDLLDACTTAGRCASALQPFPLVLRPELNEK
jgi:hypothetical protein